MPSMFHDPQRSPNAALRSLNKRVREPEALLVDEPLGIARVPIEVKMSLTARHHRSR